MAETTVQRSSSGDGFSIIIHEDPEERAERHRRRLERYFKDMSQAWEMWDAGAWRRAIGVE